MTNSALFSSLFSLVFLTYTYQCLKIIPERASITYINETYFSDVALNVRRVSRRGDYVANLDYTTKLGLGKNISVDVIFYEYLHNEFRRSFVELHFKICDLVLKDPFIGSIIRRAGVVTCPIPPGTISLKNVSLDMDIPSVWPFEKGKGEMILTDDLARVVMVKGEIVLTFKQNSSKSKKSLVSLTA